MNEEISSRIKLIQQGIVPRGYKITKSGICPQEWKTISLGELGVSKNGLNFHSDDSGYKIRMLGVSDFKELSELHGIETLSEISLTAMPDDDYLLHDGDIVFVRSNGSKELVGRNLLVYPGNNPVSYSGFCIRFRMTDLTTTTPKYINLILDSGILKSKLKKDNQGSNINNLNQNILNDLSFNIPTDNTEQERIVRILNTQNRIIELKEKLIAEKQQQKKYLMQKLLTGKQKLSGFGNEWKRVKLGQIFKERKEQNKEQNLRICSVAVQKGVVDQVEHLGRSYASTDTSNYGVVHYGDIVYTKSPTGDFPFGIIKQSHLQELVAVSPLYGIYQPTNYSLGYLLHTYFEYAVNAKNYLRPIIQKGAKNTINITNDGFISNSLYLPIDPNEQAALANLFETADKEISVLQTDIELEKQKKKALMQLLLTGIVRVKV